MSASDALVRAGVDADRIEVQERAVLGPHLFVDCGDVVLSIVGEIDTGAMVARAGTLDYAGGASLPLRSDVVEIGLLRKDRRELLAEPIRYVPFERAAEICRQALAGDVSAFDEPYAFEEQS